MYYSAFFMVPSKKLTLLYTTLYLTFVKLKKGYKQLSFVTLLVWRHLDSNQGPSACKADALNQLSYASIVLLTGGQR
jgi:hypothetical protein